MKPKPPCETIMPWLKANFGTHCLAPLTGTDSRALQAAVQIIELYAYDNSPEVIEAFARVVLRMQPKCRELAYHAIAHVLDWSDRAKIWAMADLAGPVISRCAYEPVNQGNSPKTP